MRVCIVGASGKLGQYMVQHSLDHGYEVVGVCREQSVEKLDAFEARITVIPGATDDREIIERAVAGCHGVLVVLVPRGELDMATQGELRAALQVARASGAVVLDLGALRFLDTSGLRLILETAEASRRDGFSFSVLPGSAAVQRRFEVAGVAELVPFEDPA